MSKHASICGSRNLDRPVDALPGIGDTYSSRLFCHGVTTVRQIYNEFKSRGFGRSTCENWLYSLCNINSRYFGMCFDAIVSWHQLFGDEYSPQKPAPLRYSIRTAEAGLYSPPRSPAAEPEPVPYWLRAAEAGMYTLSREPAAAPAHVPPRRYPDSFPQPSSPRAANAAPSHITTPELMQMMADFRSKQDAMATKINNLEQEKLKTDNYVKTLETKIQLADKNAAEMQKRHEGKIASLTQKLHTIDRTENYKIISSSIYMLDQKFNDLISELNEIKQHSNIVSYVKTLEDKIEQTERKANKIQKQQEDKISFLSNKMIGASAHFDRFKEISNAVGCLAEKFDDVIKQQHRLQKNKSTAVETIEGKLKHLERDLGKLTIEIYKVKRKSKETKKGSTSDSDKKLIESGIDKIDRFPNKNKTLDQMKGETVEEEKYKKMYEKFQDSDDDKKAESKTTIQPKPKLSPQTMKLLDQVKEFAMSNNFKHCWVSSRDRAVIYLMHRSQKAKLIRIDSEEDLTNLKMKMNCAL